MTLKTRYEEIIHIPSITKVENPINQGDLLQKAQQENLTPAVNNPEKVLVLGIDVQKDFMPGGSLAVPGAGEDVARATQWIYNNMDKISQIMVSIDTHNPFQIFHPCWWVDRNGINPPPFTTITSKDVAEGKWSPVFKPAESVDYVNELKNRSALDLMIWPYHCIEGTLGHSLENQFANMLYFFSVAKSRIIKTIVKGFDPLSEMYGIFKPEYAKSGFIDLKALNAIEAYDKIIVFGEAKDFCVRTSIAQMLDQYKDRPEVTSKVFFLEDCSSNAVLPADQVNAMYDEFRKKYKVNLVKSTEFSL